MKPNDRVREATDSFINMLMDLGYSANDIIEGMDEALDRFETTMSLYQP